MNGEPIPQPNFRTIEVYDPQPEPVYQQPQPVAPAPTPQPKPLPQPDKPKKNPNKGKFIAVFFFGLLLGIALLSTLITFDVIDYYISNDKCQDALDETNINSYNSGALFIMNHTLSTGMLPYLEDGELKEIKCNALEV